MPSSSDIPPEILRRHGREVVDWIVEYLQGAGEYPVLAQVRPGDIRGSLPEEPPQDPEPLDAILRDFREILLPGVTHWNHPRFFAYFAITGSGPGILGEALSAALNVNAMVWRTSPAATELEGVALDWLRRMVGLPEGLHGHINDTASVSTLVALAAARERITQGKVRERGMAEGPRLRLYTSTEAHSSVEKAAIILGLGQEGVRKIEVGDGFEMQPQGLDRAIREDKAAGWTPMAVCATVGTTSTTSIDPVAAIGRICAREDIWLHVDAAYGGSMAVVPEFRWVLDGCEHADSVVINPHKWLFVPIDCSAFYTRRPEVVRRAFSLVPPYLMTPEGEEATNLMDYGPSLGRRFRALKLWMVIRAFGVQGIAERIRTHVELARTFARWIDDTPGWERLAPTPMSTVLFRHLPAAPSGRESPARSGSPRSRGVGEDEADRHNQALLDRINASGQAFLSHTQVRGRLALRLAVGNLRTTEEDLRQTWDLLRELADGA